MTIDGKSWLERLLDELKPTTPYTQLDDREVIDRLSGQLGAGDSATEIWEELTKELRFPVVRRNYAYEWNMFRRALCITRLPSLIDCERIAELYQRSTPEEVRRRIRELTGVQFESFLKSVLSSDRSLANVSITCASHDGGIDFKGSLVQGSLRLPLIGQAKQTKSAVTAALARDFIGALDTSGEAKSVVGLYVSTGGFTEPAVEAFERSRFHIMTWGLDDVANRAVEYGVGVQRIDLEFVLVDDTFWDELSGKT